MMDFGMAGPGHNKQVRSGSQKAEGKESSPAQDNKEDDTAIHATPNLERSCSLCNEPIGHHVLQCTKETLQDTLKDVTHNNPVEPLTGPPKILPSYPILHLAPLSPDPFARLLSKFSVNESVAKMHTGPPSEGVQMVTHSDNSAKSCAGEAVTRRN